MFVIAFVIAAGLALPLYGSPTLERLASAPAISYEAGVLIVFGVILVQLADQKALAR